MENDLRSSELLARLLLQRGALTAPQVQIAWRLFVESRGAQPFGAILVQRGMVSVFQMREFVGALRTVDPNTLPPLPPMGGAPKLASAVSPGSPAPTPAAPRPAPAPAPAPAPVLRPAMPAASVPPPVARPAAAAPAPRPASSLPKPTLASLIESAERKGASDLHLHSGAPISLRIEGKLENLNQLLSVEDQQRLLIEALEEPQRRILMDAGELDFAYVTPSGLRTRANVYRTGNGLDGTFRLLRRTPPRLEELGMPLAVSKLVGFHQGLVLVTGPAGAGKSTTLASLVDLLNERSPDHILSLEDPIETVHPVKRALVNQRQVGRDTESFARALRGALREDPDVIVIGELRDQETISLAITAAETGHLVIGSMQTNSAARTVSRLIDVFPPAQQAQVRAMLSESLRGVVSQRLVPGVDGKRVPATELLFVTPAIGNLIREGKLFQIKSSMQTGRTLGMCTLDDSLIELVKSGRVSAEEARLIAENPALIPGGPPPEPEPQPAPTTARPMPATRPPPSPPPAPSPPAAPRRPLFFNRGK